MCDVKQNIAGIWGSFAFFSKLLHVQKYNEIIVIYRTNVFAKIW